MSAPFIHPTAIIDKGAIVGAGSKIWHWAHVSPGAVLGDNCTLGQNVYIGNDVVIGASVKIQNNVSVFQGVELEDCVFCGPGMTFTNVSNPRSMYPKHGIYEKTLVRQGATLGAHSTVVCGSTIGRFAFIGAGAVVKGNVPDFALVVGVPARQIGWMSKSGIKLDLPLSGEEEFFCEEENVLYILNGNHLVDKPVNTSL